MPVKCLSVATSAAAAAGLVTCKLCSRSPPIIAKMCPFAVLTSAGTEARDCHSVRRFLPPTAPLPVASLAAVAVPGCCVLNAGPTPTPAAST